MRIGQVKLNGPATAALFCAALAAGCASSDAPKAQTPAQDTAPPAASANASRVDVSGPVTVALLAPLGAADREASTAARDIVAAAQLAARDLGDSRFKLTVHDTRGADAGAAAAAQAALDGGAALILGPLFGANAGAVGAAAQARGVNVISFSNTPSAAGGNVWLIGQLARADAERVISFAASRGVHSTGVFHPQNSAGELARSEVARAGSRAGVSVGPSLSYPRSFEGIQEASEGYAESHLASGAQAVVLPDYGQGLRAAASFLDYHGVSNRGGGRLLGFSSWMDSGVEEENSMLGGWFAAPDPATVEQFEQRFREAYGRAPTSFASLGYDAVAVAGAMLAVARERGDDAPFAAGAITDPGGFLGVDGAVRFMSDGLNERALAVLEVSEDGITVIDPAPRSFTAGPGA